jgi:hypothetical protein
MTMLPGVADYPKRGAAVHFPNSIVSPLSADPLGAVVIGAHRGIVSCLE